MARYVFDAGGSPNNDLSVADNYDLGAVPGNGDSLVLTGAVNIVAGLNQAAVTLSELVIPPEMTGSYGVDKANPYKINATRLVVNGGKANSFLEGNFTDIVVNRTGTGADEMFFKGTMTRARLNKGYLSVFGGTWSDVVIDPSTGASALAQWKLDTGTFTRLWQQNGTGLLSVGTITDAYVVNGTMTSELVATLTNLYLLNAATVYHKTTTTLAKAVLLGTSILDASGDHRAKTITLLEAYENAIAKLNNLVGNITVTTCRRYGNAQVLGPDGKAFDL